MKKYWAYYVVSFVCFMFAFGGYHWGKYQGQVKSPDRKIASTFFEVIAGGKEVADEAVGEVMNGGSFKSASFSLADVVVGEQYGKIGVHIQGSAALFMDRFIRNEVLLHADKKEDKERSYAQVSRFGKDRSISCQAPADCLVLLQGDFNGSYRDIEHDPWSTIYLSFNKDSNELTLSIKSKGIASKVAYKEAFKPSLKEGDVIQFSFKE